MRKEWFEKVGGKPSRFEVAYATSSLNEAFRTLLAEDAAVDELDLQSELGSSRAEVGVRVYGHDLGNGEWAWSPHEYHTIDTHSGTIIDVAPLHPRASGPSPCTRKGGAVIVAVFDMGEGA